MVIGHFYIFKHIVEVLTILWKFRLYELSNRYKFSRFVFINKTELICCCWGSLVRLRWLVIISCRVDAIIYIISFNVWKAGSVGWSFYRRWETKQWCLLVIRWVETNGSRWCVWSLHQHRSFVQILFMKILSLPSRSL